MRYICLVYHDEQRFMAQTDAELDAIAAQCGAWVEELNKGGHHVFSSGLQSVRTAATLRKRNGQVVTTDGPFAETKEFLGGFTILEARDLNEAIQLASRMPAINIGTIEVRPVLDENTVPVEPIDRKIVAASERVADVPANV